MKLHIKGSDKFGFKIWLPTSLLKSKFVIKNIKKHSGTNIEPFINSLPIIYRALKQYIKKNGHFVLVDIESSDGYKIFIKV